MYSKIIDGRALALKHEHALKVKVDSLNRQPKVVSILVGNDPPSLLYTKMKQKKASELFIDFEYIHFPKEEHFENVMMAIIKLNQDPYVSGIMVQLPLPREFLKEKSALDLLEKISPEKDVDGLTGQGPFLPAAVKAVLSILDEESVEIKDKFVVVWGNSRLVGAPIAEQLRKKGVLVSVITKDTQNKEQITQRADVVICATGSAGVLKEDMVKEGVVVIDVGTLVIEDELSDSPAKVLGDVDFESVSKKASKITPVPGGVGPMTVVSLLENVVESVLYGTR